jgi:DNA invertase Pin-like site-specific DNA recombinase
MLQVDRNTLEIAPMTKHTAIYLRVSKRNGQDVRSQLPDLERWATAQDQPVKFYRDKFTGKTMDRPGWKRLQKALESGEVSRIVVWRLDRLGRTAKGLTALFADLQARGIGLVSLKDGLDLSTPAGRLMANVLASVAQFETEVRAERIMAGQAAARAAGKTWGGGKPGRRVKVTPEAEETILRMKAEGRKIAAISRAVGLSRPTVYAVLDRAG